MAYEYPTGGGVRGWSRPDANGRLNSMVVGADNGLHRMTRCRRQFVTGRAWTSGIGRGSACQMICRAGGHLGVAYDVCRGSDAQERTHLWLSVELAAV
jgi:hypothetical protein